MSPTKWLNNLLFMENLLGIYRNYCIQNKIKKCLIVFQIFVQTIFHAIIITGEQFLLFGNGVYDQLSYIYCYFSVSASIISFPSVVMGICNSRTFISYFESISRVSECFKDDNKLINSLKKLCWFSITFVLFVVAFATARTVEMIKDWENANLLFWISLLVSQTILRMTILFQYLMLFVVIMIVVHLFKCLITLISVGQERGGGSDISLDEQCDITREQIQGWFELYRDLSNCCEKVTLCFGRQFFITLTLTMSNNILLLYNIININAINKSFNSDEYRKDAILILCYISVTLMPLVAGQLVRNQGVKFRRVLARLYNRMIIASQDTEMKLIKDFIRLIKKNPIEIKLLSNIPAGMYMLPVLLTFTVNYLIVMLQFNHVI